MGLEYKVGDRVRFIQDHPNSAASTHIKIARGNCGTIVGTSSGGYLIAMDDKGGRCNLGRYDCIVGSLDADQFIEKITNLKIASGQKYRIIKESPVDFFKDKARRGDVFEITESKMLGDHAAWEMINISDNERHGAVITALEKEFDEYLAPVGATVARQVPAALQNWIKQVEPHLVRR